MQDFNDGYFDQNLNDEPNSPFTRDVYPYGLNGALRVVACEVNDEREQLETQEEIKFEIKPQL